MVTRIEATITELEKIGFKVLLPGEAKRIHEAGIMLDRWASECSPPPNELGQKDFGLIVMDSAAQAVLSVFYPIVELCSHDVIDEQAGVSRRCGVYVEELVIEKAATP